jgi:hypothetical protein
MSDVFIVETPSRTAGLAVREKGGYRFHAAQRDLFHLDDRVFASFGALRAAVASNDNAPPPRFSKRSRRRRAG